MGGDPAEKRPGRPLGGARSDFPPALRVFPLRRALASLVGHSGRYTTELGEKSQTDMSGASTIAEVTELIKALQAAGLIEGGGVP